MGRAHRRVDVLGIGQLRRRHLWFSVPHTFNVGWSGHSSLGNLGSQDHQLAADAVQAVGTVVIRKETTGGDETFGFTSTGSGITSPFTITTSGLVGSQTFNNVPVGSKTVTESTIPSGWALTGIDCVDPDTGSSDAGDTATIDLDDGETVTCTFQNALQNGTLTVIKSVTNDDGGDGVASDFTINVKDGGSHVGTSPDPGSATGTAYDLSPGNYTVSEESPPAGYQFTSFSGDCDASGVVTVPAGQTKTCTVTNDDVAPKLT